jgi:hypothetical protein
VAVTVRVLISTFRECDELIARVYKGHPWRAASELDLEQPVIEMQGLFEVAYLHGDVVVSDQPGSAFLAHDASHDSVVV